MADVATDLAREIAESMTPGGSDIFKGLGGLLDMILQPQKSKAPPPTNKRLPRIVPDGKGNLIDLNTNKPVGRVSSAPQKPTALESVATAGKDSWDQFAGDLSKLFGGDFGTGLDMINKLTAGPSPGKLPVKQTMAGLSPLLEMALKIPQTTASGIIGPIRTAAQKKIVKGIFRADPEVLEQMQKSLKQFNIRAPGVSAKGNVDRTLRGVSDPVAGSYGVHQQVNPVLSEITIHPNTLRGKSPSGQIYGKGMAGTAPDLPATALHEGLHGFNTPLANETSLKSARKIVDMLSPELSLEGQAGVMGAEFGGGSLQQSTQRAMKEALSYLGETALRGGGGANAKPVYTAMKPPMFESTERNAQDYITQLLQQLSGGK